MPNAGSDAPKSLRANPGAEFGFTVFGVVPSLKNSRDVVIVTGKGGKPRSIPAKAPEVTRYEENFALQVPNRYRIGLEGQLSIEIHAWYPNWRRDCDVEIIYDLLQSTGVIENDRYVVHKCTWRHTDKSVKPRAVIRIRRVGPRPVKKQRKSNENT